MSDNVTKFAAAVAYYTFLAIPSALLVGVGAFSLFAGPSADRHDRAITCRR